MPPSQITQRFFSSVSTYSRLRRTSRPATAGDSARVRDARVMHWNMRWNARWLMGLLALSMLLGPMLGQMHRAVHAGSVSSSTSTYVAHGPVALAAAAGAEAVDCAIDGKPGAGDLAWVHALFAGHGPAECQLLDQANQGFAGPPAVLAFTAPAPDSFIPPPWVEAPRAIFVAAPLSARAPPLHLTQA